MAAVDQYLDLYREHKHLLDTNGAEPLNALRAEAAKRLSGLTLARRGDENFSNFDLEAALTPDYGLNLGGINMQIDPERTFHCDVPVSSKSVMMTLNGTFAARPDTLADLPDGVEAGSLREYARLYPEEISRHYSQIADMENPLVALNTLLTQDGLYIRVKRGVKVEKPLQLVNILSAATPLMAVRRILIVIEDDASVSLLSCDHSQSDTADMLALSTVEIYAGRNSIFNLYDLEESTLPTTRLSTLWLEQQEGSQVTIDNLTLFNGKTRNEFYCRFMGEHASLRLYGMGIEDRDRIISTYSHIDHKVASCKSDELFKFTIDDDASADFTGRIHVAPGASGTEAYQANRNLVGNRGAKIYSKPQLEIYNDDVKCSHGSATGQLDPMEIFYMRTRGIPEATAKQLLRQAFMADVISAVEVPSLRDRLHLLTERRFAGLDSACSSCRQCNRNHAD
ncbi:MAG: SufD family Fe-S cluster assembly protein [Muribaculaceae bacterium]|nr:SufD family Fe-S cluster assembly protein [Muribaculaceae bacterium]